MLQVPDTLTVPESGAVVNEKLAFPVTASAGQNIPAERKIDQSGEQEEEEEEKDSRTQGLVTDDQAPEEEHWRVGFPE